MYSLDSILESPLLEKIHLHAARIVEIVSHCMKEELEDTKCKIEYIYKDPNSSTFHPLH
jgi:hypothetical protein